MWGTREAIQGRLVNVLERPLNQCHRLWLRMDQCDTEAPIHDLDPGLRIPPHVFAKAAAVLKVITIEKGIHKSTNVIA